jgi:23S rRNA pseudouridine2605 synthase
VARSSHAWRDHSRNDNPDPSPEPREDTQLGETAEAAPREVQQRPAFGGRGAYRERKPSPRDGRERRDAAPPPPKKSGERIAKLMARAGLCSRREAEEWIRQGRVTVNGRVIDSPALDIVERDIIAVDGAPLPERERTRMFLYHKPRGLVTTHSDPEGRATIFDNLPQDLPRLISIGRLDYNTEGLLLLTNDGGLKRTLELPDTGWLRRYRVRAYGTITQARLDGLRDGIEVDGVKYGPIEATLDSEQGTNVWITFAIREGKNREVRNVLSSLGLEVNRLIRVSYGPFQLGELVEGAVEEIRGRHLRDQLGERIAKQSGADFSLPVREQGEAADEDEAPARPREDRREPRSRDAARPNRDDRDGKPKPKSRVGLIADSKGRRVLVQRVSEGDGERNTGKSRRPPGRYKGKRERGKPEE